MKLAKQISIVFFLSVVMFIISVSYTAVWHTYSYGFDLYGWPYPFFKVVFEERKIIETNFFIDNLLTDFSLWIGINTLFLVALKLLKPKKRSYLNSNRTSKELQAMATTPLMKKILAEMGE